MASRANASSPVVTRDTMVQGDVASGVDVVNAIAGEEMDDGSSSLSEPEDDLEHAEQHEELIEDSMNDREGHARALLDADSEAETERLEETPHKLRKHGKSIDKTPSKLGQFAIVDDELSEPQSPLIPGAGAASSTDTIATLGQKRKRSDSAESSLTSAASDLGDSPRKRSHDADHEPVSANNANEDAEGSNYKRKIEDAGKPTLAEELPEVSTKPLRGVRRKRGRHKGKRQVSTHEDADVETTEETGEPDDQAVEDGAAQSEEDIGLKKEASAVYDDVLKQFRTFKEKLYNERLAALTTELQMLTSTDCAHPEYLRQAACVDARLEKQRREAHAYYHYRLRSIRERTLGERSQLHSQFFQYVREQRESVMYQLGEDWYAIQKERRQSHQEEDGAYVYKFPEKRSLQIRQQARYNQEVSILSGLAKYVGFPAAPDIVGVEGDHISDDLKAMKISKLTRQSALPPRPLYLSAPSSSITQNERLAHEQFIEQTPWARPQGPLLNQGTPNISHTPNWAEPATTSHSATKHLIRNLSGEVQRAESPYATPLSQKRAHMERSSSSTVAMLSDGVEAPSSILAAPPTQDRLGLARQGSSDQPSPIVVSKHQQNGAGLRNISNVSGVSGASTIDAPQQTDGELQRAQHRPHKGTLLTEPSLPRQPFDTTQLHRHLGDQREYFFDAGFRPQEGGLGTPAPLSSTKTS